MGTDSLVVRAATYDATIPFTTRPPKEGEVEGRHYNFITRDQFKKMQQQGRFIEWGERNGVFYGTASEPSAVKDNVRRRQTSKTARALVSLVKPCRSCPVR